MNIFLQKKFRKLNEWRHDKQKEGEKMQKVETITPYEAGRLIGKNAEYIRAGLRANRFNFRECSTK